MIMEELDASIISESFSVDSSVDDNSLEDRLTDEKCNVGDTNKEKSLSTNRSRMSNELNFTKGITLSSTLLDVDLPNTPKLEKGKRDPMLTPRNVRARIPSSSSSSNSIEIVSEDDSDIIELTSDDEPPTPTPTVPRQLQNKVMKQSTLDALVINKKPKSPEVVAVEDNGKLVNTIDVTPREMLEQNGKVHKLETDLQKIKNMLRTVNLNSLPDKGEAIKNRQAEFELQLNQEMKKMSKMVVSKEDPPTNPKKVVRSWDEIQAGANAVVPRTFGKRAVGTYNAQKAVTMDRLHHLHESLKSCPTEHVLAEDPGGLNVEMMPHQKRALAWLLWREKEKPSGGILVEAPTEVTSMTALTAATRYADNNANELTAQSQLINNEELEPTLNLFSADDMGLGKTLTMISLMVKSIEVEGRPPESQSDKCNGGTLVVCPASILHQWSGELERRTKRGLLSCELYHGAKRETKAKKLAKYDMVVTTYAIVLNECEKNGAVFRVKWRRIILDEAHQIRNYKSQSSEAACRLSAQSRWALTGTPVHNKELDMYALLKFLRCTPFDDLVVWKRWVGDTSTGGQERLHTVISSLMLRRTKAELMEKGTLQSMPARKWELVTVELAKAEMDVYQKILLFSRTLFAQFLHQRAEKNQDAIDLKYQNVARQPNDPKNQEYFKMREKLLQFHKVKDIKQHEILVLLLRLRQICCHPSLITSMLNEDMAELGDDVNVDETNLIDQLNKLVLNDDEYDPNRSNPADGLSSQENAAGLNEVAKSILNPSNPIFSKENISSKIKVVLDVLKEKVLDTDDKAIIVSQWPSFLRLIAWQLERDRIPFDQLDGSIPVNKRMVMVDKFNNPTDKMKVLLLSLTAGGVGLNLVGANHLFLLDLHWNPQLENQAQDRIYRVGQKKPVFVYKFMATDTIEKRILDLQEKKLDIANSMLTGTKQAIRNKLSLEDLKLLFDM